MIVAVSGTRGTGKSSPCGVLATSGYAVVDLDEVARKAGLVVAQEICARTAPPRVEVAPGPVAECHFAADIFSGALVEPPMAREIPAPEEIAAALAAGS